MLDQLKQALIHNGNVFDVLMDAVHVCSLGQTTSVLFEVGRPYRRKLWSAMRGADFWRFRPSFQEAAVVS